MQEAGSPEVKRLLVFVPEFPRLTETFISREISKLAESSKLDVQVVSLKPGNGKLPENLQERTHYRHLTPLDCLYALPHFLRVRKALSSLALLFPNPNRSFFDSIYLWFKGICYARIFSEFSPDLILAHFMSESSTLALVASKVSGIPLAISAHAKDILQEKSAIKQENVELMRQKVANSEFILICNKNAMNRVLEKAEGLDTSGVYLQYHGVNFEELENRVYKDLPEKPGVPLLLFIGRFVKKKGLKYLLQASKILKDRGFPHALYLIGLGPLYEELLSRIQELNLEDTVKVLGEGKGLPFEEASKYYKIADLFVFPSIRTKTGDVDGIANVLVEAAVYKLPIIATDAGSTHELVRNRETGLVVPQKDPKALAEAIQELLEDADLREKCSRAAYNRAREILDISQNVKEIERLVLAV